MTRKPSEYTGNRKTTRIQTNFVPNVGTFTRDESIDLIWRDIGGSEP